MDWQHGRRSFCFRFRCIITALHDRFSTFWNLITTFFIFLEQISSAPTCSICSPWHPCSWNYVRQPEPDWPGGWNQSLRGVICKHHRLSKNSGKRATRMSLQTFFPVSTFIRTCWSRVELSKLNHFIAALFFLNSNSRKHICTNHWYIHKRRNPSWTSSKSLSRRPRSKRFMFKKDGTVKVRWKLSWNGLSPLLSCEECITKCGFEMHSVKLSYTTDKVFKFEMSQTTDIYIYIYTGSCWCWFHWFSLFSILINFVSLARPQAEDRWSYVTLQGSWRIPL